MHKCNIKVSHSFWKKVFTRDPTSLACYLKFHCKSFTDDNKSVKWCPNPGCEYCIESRDLALKEVRCKCNFMFCFKCGISAHRPASCEIADKWRIKNGSESENITWIIANTKLCPNPKCGKPIEKS
jgi:ariadne-1